MYNNIGCRHCDHWNHRCKMCCGIEDIPTRSQEDERALLLEFAEYKSRECRKRTDEAKKMEAQQKVTGKQDGKQKGKELGGGGEGEYEEEEWDGVEGDEEEREEDALAMVSRKARKN